MMSANTTAAKIVSGDHKKVDYQGITIAYTTYNLALSNTKPVLVFLHERMIQVMTVVSDLPAIIGDKENRVQNLQGRNCQTQAEALEITDAQIQLSHISTSSRRTLRGHTRRRPDVNRPSQMIQN